MAEQMYTYEIRSGIEVHQHQTARPIEEIFKSMPVIDYKGWKYVRTSQGDLIAVQHITSIRKPEQ